MGWEAGINKTFQEAPQFMWIYTLTVGMAALLILVPGAPLVFLMVLSAVINGILLPFVLVFAILLVNNKRLMGEHINSKFYNYVAWGTVITVICLTVAWVVSSLVT
jgi:Mn2+/Fe2+ NRAMP family transporter